MNGDEKEKKNNNRIWKESLERIEQINWKEKE